jgi:hypothetical protein
MISTKKTFYNINSNLKPTCKNLDKKKDVCNDVCEDPKYFLRKFINTRK